MYDVCLCSYVNMICVVCVCVELCEYDVCVGVCVCLCCGVMFYCDVCVLEFSVVGCCSVVIIVLKFFMV